MRPAGTLPETDFTVCWEPFQWRWFITGIAKKIGHRITKNQFGSPAYRSCCTQAKGADFNKISPGLHWRIIDY
jgi:hypothetical protein